MQFKLELKKLTHISLNINKRKNIYIIDIKMNVIMYILPYYILQLR